MEERYGPTHGAYIWGRSVHNIHIERLWCDVTRGFGRKNGRPPGMSTRYALARDLFFFGMIENGLRGFDDETPVFDADDDVDNLEEYGIDWEELHDHDILAHHTENNADEDHSPEALQNPFANDGPHTLSHVEVAEPVCPLQPEHVALLDAYIDAHPHSRSRNMNSRRAVWRDALDFCRQLYE
ncbi:hypothetical protein GGX14DRAFT_535104 [Mycena pura]|uniref:Uncharacterized protein n=1 Tax=Mycena pura TaxID=153505 RepID=A0AAD6VD25_9AGAR|nr:hypothetical protein GGX14DRAFT_535104 [Mycena pura]